MPSRFLPCGLRVERVLDDRVEHVRDAADVAREVVEVVAARPVLRQRLGRVVDAVDHLHRRRLRRGAARGARAEDVGQELPRRVGLDRRADADEATAVAEVGLERGLVRRGQRAGKAGGQEHDRAVLLKIGRRELLADGRRARSRDGEPAARPGRLDRRHTRRRHRVSGAGDDEDLVVLGDLRRLRRRGGRRRQRQSKARQSQAQTSPPHRSVLLRCGLPPARAGVAFTPRFRHESDSRSNNRRLNRVAADRRCQAC